MKNNLNKIFLVLGFIGTMLCTSYTVYSNINKFSSSLKKLNSSDSKKEFIDNEFDDVEEDNE